MSYSLFRNPWTQYQDGSNAIYAGAKLTFYATGTTTKQDTYSDSALTTSNTNPVIADDSGYFSPIYLDDTKKYKVVLSTSSDVELFSSDPANEGFGTVYGNRAVYVDTLSELKASTSVSEPIICKGRTSSGDGYEGLFVFNSSDLSSEVLSDPLNGIYVPLNSDTSGATGAFVRVDNVINVRHFGASTYNTASENTIAIQAAIDYVEANGGGEVFIPNGSYLVTTVTVNSNGVVIVGEGTNNTFLVSDSATANTLQFISGTAGQLIHGVGARNFSIKVNPAQVQDFKTAGAHVYINGVGNSRFENLRLLDWWDGFTIRGSWFVDIESVILNNTNPVGGYGGRTVIANNGFSILWDDTYKSNGVPTNIKLHRCDLVPLAGMITFAHAGYYMDSADGTWMSDCHVNKCRHGLVIDPNTDPSNFFATLQASNCYFDQALVYNVWIQGAVDPAKVYKGVYFDSCKFREAANAIAVETTSGIEKIAITDCEFSTETGYAIRIADDAAKNIRINSNQFWDNCSDGTSSEISLKGSHIICESNIIDSQYAHRSCIHIQANATEAIIKNNIMSDSNVSSGYIENDSSNLDIICESNLPNAIVQTPLGAVLTVTANAITAYQSYHAVDTSTAAQTVDTIYGSFVGQHLYISPSSSSFSLTVKDGTGNIYLTGASTDYVMNNSRDTLHLLYTGTGWREVGRGNND